MTERLRAVHSDLFSALGTHERFDTVFWNCNYVRGPDTYEYQSVHERAYVDAGYQTHRRYRDQAPHWTAPGSRALLHFSSRGDVPALYRIAEECGRELHTVAACRVREGDYGDDLVEHMLLQIEPTGRTSDGPGSASPFAARTRGRWNRLLRGRDHAFWLDSSTRDSRGRFSVMGDAAGPLARVATADVTDGTVTVRSAESTETRRAPARPPTPAPRRPSPAATGNSPRRSG